VSWRWRSGVPAMAMRSMPSNSLAALPCFARAAIGAEGPAEVDGVALRLPGLSGGGHGHPGDGSGRARGRDVQSERGGRVAGGGQSGDVEEAEVERGAQVVGGVEGDDVDVGVEG